MIKNVFVLLVFIIIGFEMRSQSFNPISELNKYDIKWTTQSKNSLGSMPIGNGDIGLNVWVEPDGSLNFYIGKTDAFSDLNQLLKLGKVRITFSSDPLVAKEFIQQLVLVNGEIILSGKDGFTCKIYVDALHPAIRIETKANTKFAVNVSLSLWRKEPRYLSGVERRGVYGLQKYPDSLIVQPDTVFSTGDDAIIWCHRNEHSLYKTIFNNQDLGSIATKYKDPLQDRTFGGFISGKTVIKVDDTTMQSAMPGYSHDLTVLIQSKQTPTVEAWLKEIKDLSVSDRRVNISVAYKKHKDWWYSFWKRSYIFVSGSEEATLVTQAYILQRYITACASRGILPPKFNGSIFNVDSFEESKAYGVDYRRWGGGYWFQNTRLLYWPLLRSGDFNLMKVLFDMYMAALPLAKERTKLYFNHEGNMFPEAITFWGAYLPDNYGWKRASEDTIGIPQNNYIKRYYQSILELSAMMLEYYNFTQSRQFLKDTLLPFVSSTLQFYDQHYPVRNGKLFIYPAQALETYWDVINPTPEVAGLHRVLNDLLKIKSIDPDVKTLALRIVKKLPQVPIIDSNGKRLIAVAAHVLSAKITNTENPELYAIFPYKIYGVGKADLLIAKNTFSGRRFPGIGCWRQDAIQAAHLGLVYECKSMIYQMASPNQEFRFPAFWSNSLDWSPDQDHGGVLMIALQAMILQNDGYQLHLMPCFPKEWEVNFRLFSEKRTIVTGHYKKGRMMTLDVAKK